jgi:membrane protease YdiL (CAAX protease family)
MNDLPEREYPDDTEEQPAEVLPAPRKKGLPWLAWPLIILVTALAALTARVRQEGQAGAGEMEDVVERMQARYAVGAANTFGQGPAMLGQLRGLKNGDLPERLRFAILTGELAGPKEAEKYIREVKKAVAKKEVRPTRDQADLLDILRRLYRDYSRSQMAAPSVSPAERRKLTRQLGWFGELALAPPAPSPAAKGQAGKAPPPAPQPQAPPDPELRDEVLAQAFRTFWTTLLAFMGGLGMAGAGLVLLIVFLILAGAGKLRSALAAATPYGGVYAETFALWMVLFAGLSVAVGLADIPEENRLVWQGGAMLLSLAALLWPVVRGVPWTQVRQDVGLTFGRQPALEPAYGLGCYLMSLPLLALGMVLVLVYVLVEQSLAGGGEEGGGSFSPVTRAAHPIVRYLAHGGWWERLQILVLASVVAPLVEETMFRGLLYRHLREASRGLGTVASFLLSAAVVSFLFAVVHPQGLLAVPLLMALAFGFCLAREWRGSLLPCMVGHGLNNGLVLLFTILALGD